MELKELRQMDNIYLKYDNTLCIISIDDKIELQTGDMIITKTFPGKYVVSKVITDNTCEQFMYIKNFRRQEAKFNYEYNMKAFIDIDTYSGFYPSPFVKDIIKDIINAVLDYKEANFYVTSM